MRLSQYPLLTLKETPAEAEVISHQLMLRAGLVRRVAAGIYTWLPMGLRVLRKVEKIVREEMDKSGAMEILMPAIQPAELWQESGRWEEYGPELLRLKDRHDRDFCVGPTHEEVITDLVRREIRSYKQLPLNFYQIQTKFRDEIRPRFGIMRGREFTMKDAYSFDVDKAGLEKTYQIMFDAYCKIFDRLGLNYRAVAADSGSIGGNSSHEFHVLAESGEDEIAFSTSGNYAANMEKAEALPPAGGRAAASNDMEKVATPGQHTIAAICESLNVQADQTLKTLLVKGAEGGVVALCLRGDHQLNTIKAEKLDAVFSPLTMASESEILAAASCGAGSIGPVGLGVPLITDFSAAHLADFVCGANENDFHLIGTNWGRDLAEPETADIRNVIAGEPSPDGNGTLEIARGIEVGHVFQLEDKYSSKLNAEVLDQSGRNTVLQMGCYGIGVSRIVAAAIEQNHDDKGIIWPMALAPFQVAILPMNAHKSDRVREAANALYQELQDAGFEVLLDDRGQRPGVMFADMELIGIPHRVVLGERGLDAGELEYKSRSDSESRQIPQNELLDFLKNA